MRNENDLPPSYYDVTGIHPPKEQCLPATCNSCQSDKVQVSYKFTRSECSRPASVIVELEREIGLPGVQIVAVNNPNNVHADNNMVSNNY